MQQNSQLCILIGFQFNADPFCDELNSFSQHNRFENQFCWCIHANKKHMCGKKATAEEEEEEEKSHVNSISMGFDYTRAKWVGFLDTIDYRF